METLGIVRILLVEGDESDSRLVRGLLDQIGRVRFEVDWVRSYGQALRRMRGKEYAAVLSDYRLGTHSGLELVRAVVEQGSAAPVIVLTDQDDPEADLQATEAGAADYLVKDELTPALLERSLRYSIRQHRLLKRIQALSLRDDLTGLYNRRGFFELAEPRVRLANRTGEPIVLLFIDLDGLKQINDSLGHEAGDQALLETAGVLRQTFRSTDVIARLGGDEFVVLAVDAGEYTPDLLVQRLRIAEAEINEAPGRSYRLALSVGTEVQSITEPRALEDLLRRADTAMYEQKQQRRPAVATPLQHAVTT